MKNPWKKLNNHFGFMLLDLQLFGLKLASLKLVQAFHY